MAMVFSDFMCGYAYEDEKMLVNIYCANRNPGQGVWNVKIVVGTGA